ncbi:MAG: hypothetical protein GF411_03820, partial [Candidatus Lokiarchaeota archaeon]|nr:hypothetical protein [Candidatus Lokiarchaeota archaeon]
MSFLLTANENRTKDYTVSIKSASGGYTQLESTDVVRVKIHRAGTTVLDLGGDATSNGSFSQISNVGDGSSVHAQASLRLAQGDLNGMKGMYDVEIAVVDDSD